MPETLYTNSGGGGGDRVYAPNKNKNTTPEREALTGTQRKPCRKPLGNHRIRRTDSAKKTTTPPQRTEDNQNNGEPGPTMRV